MKKKYSKASLIALMCPLKVIKWLCTPFAVAWCLAMEKEDDLQTIIDRITNAPD